jgi:pilus assembly protein Flp/PilA
MRFTKVGTTGRALLLRLASCTRGATSIEYGLIAALVCVGMLVGVKALGVGTSSSWSNTTNSLVNAMK